MIDAAMRRDPLLLQMDVLVGEVVERAHREGYMVQPDFAAGLRGFALLRLLVGERAGIDKGDPVVLVVIADKRDLLVLVQQLRAEHGAVPVDHPLAPVRLQYEMRQLLR